MTVDCYAHCGLDKYRPVEALDAVMRACQVSAAVLCQHLGQFDNTYIGSIIGEQPERFAGIALLDHASPTWEDALAGLLGQRFRGLRVTGPALIENPALVHEAASSGLIPVIYAADALNPLIAPLRDLARSHRTAPIVVSHLGHIRIAGGRLEHGNAILVLATEPNVYVALSGLHMYCPFPYTPLAPLVGDVVRTFGPDRVMWGSNYPVCGEGAEDYGRDLALLHAGRWGVDGPAAEMITDTTARRLWFE